MTIQRPVFKLDGSEKGSVELPPSFEASVRTDLVRKAFDVARANKAQPKGASPRAGKRHSVDSWGPGRGVSRVPRLKAGRRAAFMPGSVGGRRAHPPKSHKVLSKRINKKERQAAFRAALAGIADVDVVRGRGHRIEEDTPVPLVVEDAFADIGSTSDVIEALETLGLGSDLQRARDGVNIRAGKGKRRGRRTRGPTSLLIVTTDDDATIHRSARNIPGVEVTTVGALNIEGLAPGGDPGRLTLFTESAMAALHEREVGA